MSWSDARLLDYEPEIGRATYFYWNDAEQRFGFREVWDVDPVTDAAKAVYNQFDEKANWKGDWHSVGVIPLAILQHYKEKGIDLLRDKKALRRFLNDKDNRAFRTRPGRV